MMQYIKLDENGVTACSHPSVDRCWQYGTLAEDSTKENPIAELWTAILFKDGSSRQFKEDINDPYANAEKYLQSITINKQ